MKKIYAYLTLVSLPLLLPATPALAEDPRDEGEVIVTHEVEGDFDGVLSNLKFSIQNQGLVLSGESHLQDMLHRTALDLGYEDDKYLEAVTYEFCSADLAHKMFRSDRRNVATCPMSIAAYVLPGTPEVVHIAYRRPILAVEDEPLEKEIDALFRSIVEEATAW